MSKGPKSSPKTGSKKGFKEKSEDGQQYRLVVRPIRLEGFKKLVVLGVQLLFSAGKQIDLDVLPVLHIRVEIRVSLF